MTVDERIEKLTERHEALTQTIELMVHENRERDARLEALGAKWDKRFGQVVDALERLTHIAEIHEHRLDGLEGAS